MSGFGRAACVALQGLAGIAVQIEVHAASGLPAVIVVGLPDQAVRQAQHRTWSAIARMGVTAPSGKVVINLTPASLPKAGTHFDLAMAIAHDPKVLLLDEPSSGIAQRETEALGPLLRDIQRATGCALLIIEHDMPLVMAISDRMYCLELGEVIAEGTPQEVRDNPLVIASYLGTDERAIQRSGTVTLNPSGG